MLFPGNIAVERKVIAAASTIALFIVTYFRCKPPHFQSKPSSDFALRHRLLNSGVSIQSDPRGKV